MKNLVRLIIAGLVGVSGLGCSTQAKADTVATEPQSTVRNNVAYSEVLKAEIEQPFMTLSYGSDPLQFGKLWLAKTPHNSRTSPLIIFIHGGCWLNAYDIEHSYALTSALAKQGYTVWSLEYRRTGDEGGGWPGSLDDILAGINFIKSQTVYPISHNNVVLTGHSAGGHLALLASSRVQVNSLAGVIGLAAITDIEEYAEGENSCQQATSGFMGGDVMEKPGAYQAANPAKQALHPNSVLLQGELDSIVPLQQNLGADVERVIQPGAGHFDWIHPETEAFQTLLAKLATMTSV